MSALRDHTRRRPGRAFSLLELLAVIAIVGILVVLMIPRISTSRRQAKRDANRQNISQINSAVERWYFEKGRWPDARLKDIGADADYFPDGLPANPVGGVYELNRDFRVDQAKAKGF